MTASDPKLSGINLSRPSDSGINLQTGPGLGIGARPTRSSWLPSPTEQIPTSKGARPRSRRPRPNRPSSKPVAGGHPTPRRQEGRERTFSTTPTSKSTSRAIDADSDDKTVQLEAASDFDLDDSETGSEVFAIDEEAVDQNASTAMAPSAFAEDDEDEDDDGFDSAVSSEMSAGWASSDSAASPERSSPAMVLATRESDPEWSGLWVGRC